MHANSPERFVNTPVYTDDQVPAEFLGSYHVGDGVFRQRCRGCDAVYDSQPGQGTVMRHYGIGPHEVEVHGLDVPGINVGMLP